MVKRQEDFGRLIVLGGGPGDLGRVKSPGLWLPMVQYCQGNCAAVLTLHCLNLPSSLHSSLRFLLLSPFPAEAEEEVGLALSSNDVSSQWSLCLLNLNKQPSKS